MSPRVAGIDPGTFSFDVCGLDGGEVVLERSFRTADVGADPALLVDTLVRARPVRARARPGRLRAPARSRRADVGERELALMLLLRSDEPHGRVGVGGMRSIVRALIAAGLPLVFGPGAIHLPTIPAYRKWNRIDLGTADKVASAALCIADQARRLGVEFAETSFVMLELGGAFSAALAVDGGRIVDGLGGSAGPIGARACGAMDAEVAYLLGAALSKRTVFSGGALDPRGDLDLSAELEACAAIRATRGMARPGGGRGQGRARADGQRAGPARDPRHRAPGSSAWSKRSARGSPTWRRCGWPRASRPPRTVRRAGRRSRGRALRGARRPPRRARRERLRARPPQGPRRRPDPAALSHSRIVVRCARSSRSSPSSP